MKVYFKGFNLYQQFPCQHSMVENFICQTFENLRDFKVRHAFSVLLAADNVIIKSENTLFENCEIGNIKQIDCNDDTILALLENGDLIKLGENTKIPQLLFDSADKIVRISCGTTFTVVLSELGYLFNIPNKLDYQNPNIVDIKCGREHCLLLEKNGNVWSFGRGSRGQLGHGILEDEIEPKLIEALAGIKIVAIATGGWHSCALSQDGILYVWGWNSNGQLGLATDENKINTIAVMATPRFINLDFDVTHVACGVRHTVMLSDVGILYGCGWNKYKQLKEHSQEDFHQITELYDFSKEKLNRIDCGNWNTIVLCED